MYAWRIIYGIGVEIGVRDVLIFDEYKKRNEQPAWILRPYTTQNPFLLYYKKDNLKSSQEKFRQTLFEE